MGLLYWQINDCWPVTSWASVDGYGRPKLLWYATRRFFAPRLLTIQPEDGGLVVVANNDSPEPWQGTIQVARLTFTGGTLATEEIPCEVAARGCTHSATLDPTLATPDDPASEVLVARLGERVACWFFDVDKKLSYPEPAFDAELSGTDGYYRLTITAHVLLRDVCIGVDRLDPQATISEQLVTLLPGEAVTFDIHSQKTLTREALTQPPVFQCANRFGQTD